MADQTKLSKRYKIVLAVSLALNLLVVGMVAGAAWRHGGKDGTWKRGVPGLQGYATPYVRALPPEARRALGDAIRNARPEGARAERFAAYQQMLGALRAEPFDAATVRRLLETQGARVRGVQAAGHEGWMQIIASMTPKARAQYADRLEETLNKRAKRRQKLRDK